MVATAAVLVVLAADALFVLLVQLAEPPPSFRIAITALLDEPAHLATTLLALAALRPLASGTYRRWAVIGSVMIDFDHLPWFLARGLLPAALATGNAWPLHNASTVGVLGVLVLALGRDRGVRVRGATFGVVSHLARDVATGGLLLFWPIATFRANLPYGAYAAAVVGLLYLICRRRRVHTPPARAQPDPIAPPGPAVAGTVGRQGRR